MSLNEISLVIQNGRSSNMKCCTTTTQQLLIQGLELFPDGNPRKLTPSCLEVLHDAPLGRTSHIRFLVPPHPPGASADAAFLCSADATHGYDFSLASRLRLSVKLYP